MSMVNRILLVATLACVAFGHAPLARAQAEHEIHMPEIHVEGSLGEKGGNQGNNGTADKGGSEGGKKDDGGKNGGKGAGASSPKTASAKTMAALKAAINQFISDVMLAQGVSLQGFGKAVLHFTGVNEADVVAATQQVSGVNGNRLGAFKDELRGMLLEAKTPEDRAAIREVLDIAEHPDKYQPGAFVIQDARLMFKAGDFGTVPSATSVRTDLTRTFYDKLQQALAMERPDSRFRYLMVDSPWVNKIVAHATTLAPSAQLTLTPRDRAMMREALYNMDVAEGMRLQLWANEQLKRYPDQKEFLSWIDISGEWTASGLDVEYWHPMNE
jgi:hypothetical protein